MTDESIQHLPLTSRENGASRGDHGVKQKLGTSLEIA